jgi:hypothetical protein
LHSGDAVNNQQAIPKGVAMSANSAKKLIARITAGLAATVAAGATTPGWHSPPPTATDPARLMPRSAAAGHQAFTASARLPA